MNYYQHHIGDFDRATRHLTRLERSIYRDLIELYYDTEQPLTLDRAALCRKIIARSNEESTAVEQTLNEFFTETPTGWYHERCELEIGRYHNSTSQKAVAGKASALKRAAKKQEALNGDSTAVEQTLNGAPTNQEPLTINQEPVKAQRKPRADDFDAHGKLIGLGVTDAVANDFLTIRKKKRAPLTETALVEIQRESAKAGLTLHKALEICCARGWQGFEAGWVVESAQGRPAPKPENFENRQYGQGGKL
ncbi:MAG: YdaU family protein [Burkholderiaceae bacterium]